VVRKVIFAHSTERTHHCGGVLDESLITGGTEGMATEQFGLFVGIADEGLEAEDTEILILMVGEARGLEVGARKLVLVGAATVAHWWKFLGSND